MTKPTARAIARHMAAQAVIDAFRDDPEHLGTAGKHEFRSVVLAVDCDFLSVNG
jgi:hypothetical protein